LQEESLFLSLCETTKSAAHWQGCGSHKTRDTIILIHIDKQHLFSLVVDSFFFPFFLLFFSVTMTAVTQKVLIDKRLSDVVERKQHFHPTTLPFLCLT